MIPQWTYVTDKAATSFEIRIQGSSADGWKDLAKDAGGDYRYVFSNHDQYQTKKVTAAKLLRSGNGLGTAKMVEYLGKGW